MGKNQHKIHIDELYPFEIRQILASSSKENKHLFFYCDISTGTIRYTVTQNGELKYSGPELLRAIDIYNQIAIKEGE